jgi:hypothetical protein
VPRKEVEEIPLRHEGHEFAERRNVAEVGNLKEGVSDDYAEGFDFLMRQLEELLEEAEFFEDFESGWVDGVAAKIAEEVFVLFEHGYRDTAACQQVAKHHACRAAADYATACFDNLRCHARIISFETGLGAGMGCWVWGVGSRVSGVGRAGKREQGPGPKAKPG